MGFGYGAAGGEAGMAAGKASSVTQFASARADLASSSVAHFSHADFERRTYGRPCATCHGSGIPALLRPSDAA